MRRARRTKLLSCFYCGKQSGIKYDGSITNFDCLSCDATNYLDEDGEITDPPVATEREATPAQFARPQAASSSAADTIFCDTCLKNQRLFTASLAQYLPDDPSHPDYDELDRNYYRYRRNLERRYPQVCDDCAGKVQQRIQQAGYTAKTDHLRRMMDKTRGRKAAPTPRASPLDLISALGGWLWRGGLFAQLLWHLTYVVKALEHQDDGMYDPDDKSVLATGLEGTKVVLAWLPAEDVLIRMSIIAAIFSAWWNPHFVQFTRGFTRHLLGFTRWYSFQGLIIFLRILFRSVVGMDGGAARSQSAQLSFHTATAGVMCFIYTMARKSIKVDTTPLFRPDSKPATPQRAMTPAKRKEEDSKTFSELFNEALDSTPGGRAGSSSQAATPSTPTYASSSAFVPQSQLKFMQRGRGLIDAPPLNPPSFGLPPPQQPVDYGGDEMDWSPSQPQPAQSQHRAFQSSPEQLKPSSLRQPFGQSPTQGDGRNPFWFKVPAAPTNPARQLRNPPNMPVLRKKPVEKDEVFFTSRKDSAEYRKKSESGDGSFGFGSTSFKNPSFFAPEQTHDEANQLADLLGTSFSLSQERRRSDEATEGAQASSAFGARRQRNRQLPPKSPFTSAEVVILAPSLALWLLLSLVSLPWDTELRAAILVAAGAVALLTTNDEPQPSPGTTAAYPTVAEAALSALGVAELAGVCWVGWETWTARNGAGGQDVGPYGMGVLAVMLGHAVWRSTRA